MSYAAARSASSSVHGRAISRSVASTGSTPVTVVVAARPGTHHTGRSPTVTCGSRPGSAGPDQRGEGPVAADLDPAAPGAAGLGRVEREPPPEHQVQIGGRAGDPGVGAAGAPFRPGGPHPARLQPDQPAVPGVGALH